MVNPNACPCGVENVISCSAASNPNTAPLRIPPLQTRRERQLTKARELQQALASRPVDELWPGVAALLRRQRLAELAEAARSRRGRADSSGGQGLEGAEVAGMGRSGWEGAEEGKANGRGVAWTERKEEDGWESCGRWDGDRRWLFGAGGDEEGQGRDAVLWDSKVEGRAGEGAEEAQDLREGLRPGAGLEDAGAVGAGVEVGEEAPWGQGGEVDTGGGSEPGSRAVEGGAGEVMGGGGREGEEADGVTVEQDEGEDEGGMVAEEGAADSDATGEANDMRPDTAPASAALTADPARGHTTAAGPRRSPVHSPARSPPRSAPNAPARPRTPRRSMYTPYADQPPQPPAAAPPAAAAGPPARRPLPPAVSLDRPPHFLAATRQSMALMQPHDAVQQHQQQQGGGAAVVQPSYALVEKRCVTKLHHSHTQCRAM